MATTIEKPEPISLKDTAAYSVLANEKETLKELICRNSHSIRDASFSESFLGGSIGDIIADKLGGSSSSSCRRGGNNSSCDFGSWQVGGDDHDYEDDDNAFEDDFQGEGSIPSTAIPPDLVLDSDWDCSDSSSSPATPIEISPGVKKTLRSSNEAWDAIKNGKTMKTFCSACLIELHCIENAQYVACPECWSASPIVHEIGGIELEFDDDYDDPFGESSCVDGISLGIREEDVLQWLDSRHDV